MVGVCILLLPCTYHTHAVISLCRAVNTSDKFNFLLRLLVLEEVVWHSLCNPPSVNKATQQTNTFQLPGRMNPGACWLKKVHDSKGLGFPHTVRRQERALWLHKRCTAVLVCKQWPVVQYTKLIEYISNWKAERGGANNVRCSISLVNWSLPHDLYGIHKSTACGQYSLSRKLQSIRISIARYTRRL